MKISDLHIRKAYIQGIVILVISCIAFLQDFSFLFGNDQLQNPNIYLAYNIQEELSDEFPNSIDLLHNTLELKTTNSNDITTPLNKSNNSYINEDVDILKISLANANLLNPTANGTTEFLTIENNEANLNYTASPIATDLSSGITNTSLNTEVYLKRIQRIWTIIPTSTNTPTMSIKIPRASIANDPSLGNFYMLVSNSNVFDSNSDYRILTLDENGDLETNYKFEETAYISFGFSPQISSERSIYFNGYQDYIDIQNQLELNPDGFTISAWIKRDHNDFGEVSILSKRDIGFTKGFDITLNSDNKLRIKWKNESYQTLKSYTPIPFNIWHHVAITYNGSKVSIYIDGVLDNSAIKSAPVATNESFLIGAAGTDRPIQYFRGHIDEVRIWKTDLTEDQLRFIMNQEIANNSGLVVGKALPTSITKNDINTISWSDLAGYYPMSAFTYNNTMDASGNGNNGLLKNIITVDVETTPLPYKTNLDGDWDHNSTWANGNLQYIPGSTSIVDPNITIDWNIVKIQHNLLMDNSELPAINKLNRIILGLSIDANSLKLKGDNDSGTGNGLTITHYLNLNGKLDLEGESQLIQTLKSDLNVTSEGLIERDQQGTANTYTYNYWSSPVTKQNSEVNSFKISDVMKDGTSSSNPLPINFSSSGYNGAPSNPIRIADYWVWKYANEQNNNYSSWQHIRRTGTIFPGEGFTMKGPGTGTAEILQNYVFTGKPNNGKINLNLAADNEYLIGNPYPSAIDADKFIRDNGINDSALISGTLYFWKHYGGNSHAVQDYKGGYATYNFAGAVAAATKGNINNSEVLTQKPGRYIPVGQGFFVMGENGGTINFNNGQRVFKKEGSNSLFLRSSTHSNNEENIDGRMKFRIGFNSVNNLHRQLLLTIDESTTPNVDWAYDGKLNENQIDDMFWVIQNEAYIIQASNEAEVSTTYPLGIKTNSNGLNRITIDALENVPNDMDIYVHDIAINTYHNLRTSNYEVYLNAGEHLDRFEITFGVPSEALNIDDEILSSLNIVYANDINKIVLINPNQIEVKSIVLYNMLGQPIFTIKDILRKDHSEYDIKNLSAGAYIIKLHAVNDSVLTRKVIVE